MVRVGAAAAGGARLQLGACLYAVYTAGHALHAAAETVSDMILLSLFLNISKSV